MASHGVVRCVRVGRFFIDNAIGIRKNTFPRRHLLGAASMSTEPSKAETPPVGGVASQVESQLKEQVDSLAEKLKETTEKCNVLDDKYKRALADGENMRLRLTKQIEDAKIFCIQGFCKDLLEVSDILQRATESVPKEAVTDANPHLKSLYEGLTMTEAQLQSVFRRHGLVPVNPINEKFDPNYHEALFQQEVEGKEAGTVVVVSKIGYKLRDRVVRPALVGVAKGS